jgi:hypothetical protein
VSPAFKNLPANIIVKKKASPTDTGRGVIVFRNYIDAAIIAYTYSESLGKLITAERLARITKAALEQFQKINFQQAGKEKFRQRLQQQYRQDAEEACACLMAVTSKSPSLEEDTAVIRRILDKEF